MNSIKEITEENKTEGDLKLQIKAKREQRRKQKGGSAIQMLSLESLKPIAKVIVNPPKIAKDTEFLHALKHQTKTPKRKTN